MSRHVKGKQYTIAETPVIWPPCSFGPHVFPRHHHYPPLSHFTPYKFPPLNLLPHRTICFFLSLHLLFLSLSHWDFRSMADSKDTKRCRDESEEAELAIYSPEVKRLRENLLDSLDDDAEFGSTHDLDSFMKSFEEEITASPYAGAGCGEEAVQLADLRSDSGDSRSDLGYLFEASDDELGLPPTASEATTELVRVESNLSELGSEFWEAPGYDSFEFGFGGTLTNYGIGNGEYAALDGLFDYSDMGLGSGDFGRRPETLPAQ